MPHKTLTQLNQVLSQEREALLEGKYDDLPKLADAKAQLLDRLAHLNPPTAELRHLKARMDSNQDLIVAALQGVAAAKDRIEALEDVRDGLRTYDQSGQVAVVAKSARALEKKA